VSELVRKLTQEQPIAAILRPGSAPEQLKAMLGQGYVHIEFTETRGGTELGIELDPESTDLSGGNFDEGTGSIQITGDLVLDYTPVRFHGSIDLESMRGRGRLELREDERGISRNGDNR
jgi:core binding factor beta subunit